ncbi:MAG TPA: multicopper oxidase family protein [Gemmatimonadales bacterium]|jgi:FtsP/CotA-like multicopper oxidase with cupredoxin domain|nr:multicopper oxidase family protein [Gemmatimonadales bacterium]
MRRAVLLALPAALAISATPYSRHPATNSAQIQSPETPCGSGGTAPRPSRDLYCVELVPIPALEGVTATFELNRMASPFGVNVTRDGLQVYAPLLSIAGLPEPAAFSKGARVWIAWIATQQLNPTRKLGTVGNGSYVLPAIDWPKFLILITAEASPEAKEPDGRVALRGFSPSSRMQPPDMAQFLYGAAPVADTGAAGASGAEVTDHSGHRESAPAGGATTWVHPPMPAGLAMMPAEMRLPFPLATPFLPSAERAAIIPDARPRQVVRLGNGDTLVLTAGPVRQTVKGQSFIGYGYNGQVPGPLIWAQQGSTIQVRFRNHTEWPSTVHWHGVRLANRFDGADGVTQGTVPPGGAFDYTVHLPDAGLFWYHPHRRDDILRDLGLYGNLLVTPTQAQLGPANREEVLMLDDLELTDRGPLPYGAERPTHALMGRFGNVMLLNGRTDWSLTAARGEVVRFLLTNISNARTFNVSFGGARIKLLGSDLSNFEREEWVESVVVAPAERYLVAVRFPDPGRLAIENRVLAIDHVFGRFFSQVDTLGMVRVTDQLARPDYGAAFNAIREHAGVIADIDRFRDQFERPPDRALVVRMEANGLPFAVDRFLRFDSVYFHPVEWSGTMPMMNWNSTSAEVRWILEEPGSGRQNMDIHWEFKVGDLVRIRIANLRATLHAMQHPIHFHGQRFLVLAQNGVRNTNLAWKDTFLLPAGGTADLLLEVSNPGTWMAHCHISEHLESGMMMTFSAH